jgi:rhodanese-related sulfurtransferase
VCISHAGGAPRVGLDLDPSLKRWCPGTETTGVAAPIDARPGLNAGHAGQPAACPNRPATGETMKPMLYASLLAAALTAMPVLAQETPATLSGVRVVTAEQVVELGAKGAALIDTRVANEFAEKTVRGAISVVYRERSAKSVDFDRSQDSFDLSKLPADKAAPVVFFCNSGTCWRSYKAAVVARDAGHTQVGWFRGGMPEWNAKGLPTQ